MSVYQGLLCRFLHFLFFIMGIWCVCNNKNVSFDSVTKSKYCWGQGVAVLCATLGLNESDKEEKGLEETEIQWTQGLEEIDQRGNVKGICEENFKRKGLICRIPKCHGRGERVLGGRFGACCCVLTPGSGQWW